ncbi:MAG: hypothetical protein JXB39_07510 [Deltaproteobacteria bacterium]|nr:hypothetical protein [Deltaproteobacteria bacterium]
MQVLLLSTLLAGPVHAVAWSDLAGVFPPLPCPDGWAGCVVDGVALNADMRLDSQGVPMPAELRFDWFTLEGAPGLSPFAPLSSYSERVAEAAPPEEPYEEPYEEVPAEEERLAAGPDAGRTPFPVDPGSASGAATSQGRLPVSSPSATGQAGATATGGGAGMRPGFSPTGSLPSQGASGSAAVAGVAPATCNDLVALESSALMGQLSGGQRSCLEDRLASAGRQTEKDKVSRVLLNDAEARGDKATWARLMKRHLEEIDRSDPDLCFKYAIYLSRLDVGRANGVIRWADYALENKANWKGATYVSRVAALLKLKAEAANRIWQAAEEAYVESRTEENEAKATRYRNTTKAYAREWLDYARVSGQDTKNAMALCVSAAGNRQFCEGK